MIKRLFDIIASSILLLIVSPLMLVLAICIVLDDPGPVFYRARRIGRHGNPIQLFKFRSMRINADKVGPKITTNGDPRITRMGQFLRHFKLDEFPQLFNVLLGDMSLVGPRPEDPKYVALYTEQEQNVLTVRPGITSFASLQYRHEERLLIGENWEETYTNRIMRDKLALDLHYVQTRTLLTDLQILWRTVLAIFQ